MIKKEGHEMPCRKQQCECKYQRGRKTDVTENGSMPEEISDIRLQKSNNKAVFNTFRRQFK